MTSYRYLIIGGGMTADAAARAIRESDPTGPIGIISDDPHPPYNRPPLSKGLWKGDDPAKTVWRGTDAIGVDLRLGRRVTAIHTKQKTITDDRGTVISYEKLLLATGGTPRRLPMQTGQIIYYRTFDDYTRLRALANERLQFVVLGGGFIGSEVAAALRIVGRDVTMIVPEDGIGARVFPTDLSKFLVDYYREQGVDVRTGEGLADLRQSAGKVTVRTTHGKEIPADVVVAGLGIQPNVELAEQAGLRVENGIVGDEMVQTSAAGVYAGGGGGRSVCSPARRTSTGRATSPSFSTRCSARGCASSTRTTPTRWARQRDGRWPAPAHRTRTRSEERRVG